MLSRVNILTYKITFNKIIKKFEFLIYVIVLLFTGSYHIDGCEMEPKIPIFMIVSGIASIFLTIFTYCFKVYSRWERSGLTKCSIAFAGILFLFSFAWNVAGAYWVFKEWDDWEGKGCHKETYLYIFSLSIIYWIALPFSCFSFFKGAKDANEDV